VVFFGQSLENFKKDKEIHVGKACFKEKVPEEIIEKSKQFSHTQFRGKRAYDREQQSENNDAVYDFRKFIGIFRRTVGGQKRANRSGDRAARRIYQTEQKHMLHIIYGLVPADPYIKGKVLENLRVIGKLPFFRKKNGVVYKIQQSLKGICEGVKEQTEERKRI